MALAARMDEHFGRGGWIAAMVLGFILYWPVGMAFLFFLVFTGRMRRCRSGDAPGRWYNQAEAGPGAPWGWNWNCGSRTRAPQSSGNRAFDDYRTETLKRLEEEQREFLEYLERLRRAKDKQEFDQFMADRRSRSAPTVDQNGGDAA